MVLSAQSLPLLMLAVNKATNSAILLHDITKFYPSIGFHQGTHPASGTMIALMGKAPSFLGALPPVITILLTAFEDAQMWAVATNNMINAASPTDPLLQLDNHHQTSMARIIPIPILPQMVPLFFKNTNSMLLNLMQLVKTMHDMAPLHTQQMCTLPMQFLWAATIAAPPTTGHMESQLAIPLLPVQTDQTITQWATARYFFYHMLPPQPPHITLASS